MILVTVSSLENPPGWLHGISRHYSRALGVISYMSTTSCGY